jgi:hypothetical protein
MRKTVLIALILTALTVVQCGNSSGKDSRGSVSEQSGTGKGSLVFIEYEHDFGRISEGQKVSFVFSFVNKGTGSLVIASATTSCGCTIPKYDTNPISPGGAGKLEVVYDATGKDGRQTKTITVRSNAEKPVTLLKITAEVVPATNN